MPDLTRLLMVKMPLFKVDFFMVSVYIWYDVYHFGVN